MPGADDPSSAPLAQTERGDGEPVLLLHGSASSGAMWRRYIEPLAGLGCRVLAPDLIGYGASGSWPAGTLFRLGAEVGRLRLLVPRDARRWHLVGHSYGGLVALGLAVAMPEALATLTLIEPVAFFVLRRAGETAALAEVSTVRDAVVAALEEGRTESALRAFLGYWSGPSAWDSLSPRVQAELRRSAEKIGLDWAAAFDTDLGLAALDAIRARSLLIHGSLSPLPTQRVTARLAEMLPDARLLVIPGASHLLPLTHGAALLDAIAAHVQASRTSVAPAAPRRQPPPRAPAAAPRPR